MQKSLAIPFCALSFLFASCLSAQNPPDYSGEWKMDIAKSDFGKFPAPAALTRTVEQTGSSLVIKTYQKGKQGEVRSELKYTTDGKECVNHLQGGDAKGTLKFQGPNIVIESTRDYQGTEIRSKEIWTLSNGGQELTIQNHVTIAQQGEADTKLVLSKQ
jgi:hypothetical protein